MDSYDFKELFEHICEIKTFVLQLSIEDLKKYKATFYNQQITYWALNIMWEFIWDDKDYDTMKQIFINANLIKKPK